MTETYEYYYIIKGGMYLLAAAIVGILIYWDNCDPED